MMAHIQPSSSSSNYDKLFARFLFLSYLGIRFLLQDKLLLINNNILFIFDLIFIIVCSLIYKKDIPYRFFSNRYSLIECPILILLGYITYLGTSYKKMLVPIDIESATNIIMLLAIAPILEEFLFRQSLWPIFQRIFNHPFYLVLASSLLFSLSHYYSSDIKIPIIQSFINYQTFYTFILGIWLGLRYLKTKSIFYAIVLHFCFNLGFFIGLLN